MSKFKIFMRVIWFCVAVVWAVMTWKFGHGEDIWRGYGVIGMCGIVWFCLGKSLGLKFD